MHEPLLVYARPDGPSDRSFGLTVGGILVAIGLIRWLLASGPAWLTGTLLVAGAGLVAGALLAPAALAPLNRGWMRLGHSLARIVNPIVMALIFALTVVPTGLVMRLRGRDLLRLRREPAARSYWIERQPPDPAPDTMQNQF